MGETLARIRPTLSYDEFKEVDIVIEAVTENPKVKGIVLAETEKTVRENTDYCVKYIDHFDYTFGRKPTTSRKLCRYALL